MHTGKNFSEINFATLKNRQVTRKGEGSEDSHSAPAPTLFRKLEKISLIFRKKSLIVAIYELNVSFEMQLLRVSRRKNQRFYPTGPLFFVL